MSRDRTAAALSKASDAFLTWGDEWCDNNGGDETKEALRRSIGFLRMAEYVHALANVARDAGTHSRDLEPARRMAIALHDAGNGFATSLFRHETAIHDLAETRWGGRKSPSRLTMEGRVVGCICFLAEIGWPIRNACAHVAAIFNMAGHKGRKGGRSSSKSVRGWFDGLVMSTGEASEASERGGWAEVDTFAELARQREALETTNRLLQRQLDSGGMTQSAINIEMMTLAHSCSANPPSAMTDGLSH